MTRIAIAAAAAAVVIGCIGPLGAGQASSAVTVLGTGFAAQCFSYAKDGRDAREGLIDCDRAVADEVLSRADLAATYVNRGVLHMVVAEYAAAQQDFERSVAVDGQRGEAYINLGAVKIAQGRFADAIADIDRGLALGPQEPEKAYYNRAIADELLGDLKAAYSDYTEAATLRPAWPAPRLELARFTVRPAH